MREIKSVEVRKKEILDASISVFQEKGYDKTSISDIAAALGISQGLCYRYFKSKEEIFESAVDAYAQHIADKLIGILEDPSKELPEKISCMPDFANIEKEDRTYYDIFHGQGTDSFHDRLSLAICRKVCPHVQALFSKECEAGRIRLEDPDTAAAFIVFGQLGILLYKDIPREQKNKKIIEFLETALKKIAL